MGQSGPLLLIAALFAFALRRRRALGGPAQAITRGERSAFRALQALHSGLVSDYVTWMAAGLALFAPAAGFPVGPTGP